MYRFAILAGTIGAAIFVLVLSQGESTDHPTSSEGGGRAVFAAVGHSSKGSGRPFEGSTGKASACAVGQSPTLDVPRAFSMQGARVLTQPTIVGCRSRSPFGRIELVAYTTSKAFCFSVDRPRLKSSIGGVCKQQGIPVKLLCPNTPCLTSVEGTDFAPRTGFTSTVAVGIVSPQTSGVSLMLGRPGSQRKAPGLVAQIAGARMKEFHQTEEFGFFAAIVKPCIPPQNVRALARDVDGNELGWARGLRTFSHPCKPR